MQCHDHDKKKVMILMCIKFHDVLSEWHQIYSGGNPHAAEATFKFEENPCNRF